MQWWQRILPIQGHPALDEILLQKSNQNPTSGPDPENEDRVMLIRHMVSRIFYLRKFFDYPISLKLETFTNMGLSRTLKSGFGYLYSSVNKKKETSLENFYINRFGRPLYKMFFENYTEKVWGVHPSCLGADWGAQRVKGLSLMGLVKNVLTKPFKKSSIHQKNIETSLIENFIYPKYGPGQLWEAVASDITNQGVNIDLNHRVKSINFANNRIVSVTVETGDNEKELECDCLISSMPIKDLVCSMQGINIPENISQIAAGLPYRDFITVGLLVDKLLIKNKTKFKTWNLLVPDTWIYIQEADVKMGRLQIFNNWSPYMVEDYKNKVWIGLEYFCSEGDNWWKMSDDEFIAFAVEELDKIGIIDKKDVQDAIRVKIKKAYPSYHGTYTHISTLIEFLDRIENLYCIGRNGQHRYNNMDHSMLTAIEAVRHLSGEITDRSIIWNVNTEKDYHEKKTP